jgi:hypothetical protein
MRSARSRGSRRPRTMNPIPRAVPRPRATPAQIPARPSELNTTPTRSKTGRSTLTHVMFSTASRTSVVSGGCLLRPL